MEIERAEVTISGCSLASAKFIKVTIRVSSVNLFEDSSDKLYLANSIGSDKTRVTYLKPYVTERTWCIYRRARHQSTKDMLSNPVRDGGT